MNFDYTMLRIKREEMCLSMTECAREGGITFNTLWKWESGDIPQKMTPKLRKYIKFIKNKFAKHTKLVNQEFNERREQ